MPEDAPAAPTPAAADPAAADPAAADPAAADPAAGAEGILAATWELVRVDELATRVAAWLPELLAGLLTLLAFWVVHRILARGLRFVMQRAGVDDTAVSFLDNVFLYAMFTIAAITALAQVGVDVTGILASMGVIGLTVGFAARDALSNVISGLFIFWDRPFVLGDLVEIDDVYGRVEEITLRSTRIVTPDGRMLAIPNTTIVNSKVASYTNFPHLRLDIDVTVGTGEDLGRCRELLCALPTAEEGFMAEPAPKVVVTALNDYNVALQLRAWLDEERGHVDARMRLRERVFETLRTAGVDMPCETLALDPVRVVPPERASA